MEKAHKAYAFREEIDGLRGRGRRGSTSVTVDATGLLLAVTFDDDVSRLSPKALAAEVLGAVQAAQHDVAEAVSRHTRAVWGNDDAVTMQMEKELAKRFEPSDPDADLDREERR